MLPLLTALSISKCGTQFCERGKSIVTKILITQMNKTIAPLRAKNDVTQAFQLKLHERLNKKQVWSVCDVIWSLQKSRRRNRKNQEKANNSPSYRCAAIKQTLLLFQKLITNNFDGGQHFLHLIRKFFENFVYKWEYWQLFLKKKFCYHGIKLRSHIFSNSSFSINLTNNFDEVRHFLHLIRQFLENFVYKRPYVYFKLVTHHRQYSCSWVNQSFMKRWAEFFYLAMKAMMFYWFDKKNNNTRQNLLKSSKCGRWSGQRTGQQSVPSGQWYGQESGRRSGQRSGIGSVRSGPWSAQRSGRWSGQRSGHGSVRSGQWSGERLFCLASSDQSLFGLAQGGQSLFGLANTYLWVWSVWPIPIFGYGWSGQYLSLGMVGLANTYLWVWSVWPIPIFGYGRFGQYLSLGMVGLANTYLWVWSVWPIPIFGNGRSGQYLSLGMVGLANTYLGSQTSSW